jgi:hypothetical protein
MPDICAQTFYGGAWRVVCQKGADDAEGRAWLARQIKAEFGEDAPVTYLRMDERGLYQPITGMCEDGCNCRGATCKGRPQSRPPQAGARTRPGRRPPPVGRPVHAEDLDVPDDSQEDDTDDLGPDEIWSDRDPMHGGKKPKKPATAPRRPAESGEDEAEQSNHLLALVSALVGHLHRVRRGSKEAESIRSELSAAAALLPRTLIGESLRSDANNALAASAAPRVSASRRKWFLELHGAR